MRILDIVFKIQMTINKQIFQLMARHRAGDQTLPKPMITQTYDTTRHSEVEIVFVAYAV